MTSTKPFRFGLERVRTVRKHSEDVAAQELSDALDCLNASTRELHRADQRIAAARAATRDARELTLSGAEMVAAQSWLECAEQARETLARNHARDERAVTMRRAALTQALGARKALDLLEQRQRDEFDRETARAEVVALDEIALTPFGRPVAA